MEGRKGRERKRKRKKEKRIEKESGFNSISFLYDPMRMLPLFSEGSHLINKFHNKSY